MSAQLKILFVSSEVAPFAKAGGLGDVAAALPRHLHDNGHQLLVFVPLYRRIAQSTHTLESVPSAQNVTLQIGPHRIRYSLKRAKLPGSELYIHFVDCPWLFDRENIYGQEDDEHLRFILLTWAALSGCQQLEFSPDIAHCNDWQTAFLPLLLKTQFAWDQQRFANTRTVLSIHNLAHQGAFPADRLADTGMADSADLFHQEQLEAGVVNALFTGVLYADAVTTVSPTYAREIQGDELGGSLAPLLRERSSTVVGILNGIDDDEWNPAIDPHIEYPYSSETIGDKAHNKRALLESLGLSYLPSVPVAGVISRLVWQKGIETVLQALPPLLQRNKLQLIVLGSGADNYEHELTQLQKRFPRHVCYYRGYSERLSHRIEAGADMFLMPSRYEPCGLNQMYSMRYGTVPIVRNTGGLADSVIHFNVERARRGEDQPGTGFVFEHSTAAGLTWAIEQALEVWQHPASWRALQQRGMAQDMSWRRRVADYETLYQRVMDL